MCEALRFFGIKVLGNTTHPKLRKLLINIPCVDLDQNKDILLHALFYRLYCRKGHP
ncbi:MAG: hypothetical protein OEX82_04055 [Nitrosomonas sp.]|nr:hypothetical protein [Nitrosomonas sp.]